MVSTLLKLPFSRFCVDCKFCSVDPEKKIITFFYYFVQYTQSGSSQLRKILDRQKRKAENDSDMDSGSPNSNVVFDLEGECSSFLAVHHYIIFS